MLCDQSNVIYLCDVVKQLRPVRLSITVGANMGHKQCTAPSSHTIQALL